MTGQQKRIIVTGGAGFIGSALCRRLVSDPDIHVTALDKLTYAASEATLAPLADLPNFELVKQDICDQQASAKLIHDRRPDTIFHLAAETHVDRSISGSAAFIQTNIIGTHALLEGALDYWRALDNSRSDGFRFVHISTDEVYGSLGSEGLFCEDTAYDPSSPYSASKASSDHLVMAWHRTYGLPTLISNCSNNYGPYQFPEKLIPLMIINALNGQPLPIYGKGENIRDWLFVDDHVDALIQISEKGRVGQTYNVGGNCERTNLQIVEDICSIMDRLHPSGAPHARLITHVQDRPGHDLRYAIDANKISTDIGWQPAQNLQSGLEQTVAWYCENKDWWAPIRDKVYDGRRLGLPHSRPATKENENV